MKKWPLAFVAIVLALAASTFWLALKVDRLERRLQVELTVPIDGIPDLSLKEFFLNFREAELDERLEVRRRIDSIDGNRITPWGQKTRSSTITTETGHPDFSTVRRFKLFGMKGEISNYYLDKPVEHEPSEQVFENGEFTFIIMGDGKGMAIGNEGAGEVVVSIDRSSVSFVETTLAGNKHTLTVYDDWTDSFGGGFRCNYIRNVELLPGRRMVSDLQGVAKPF